MEPVNSGITLKLLECLYTRLHGGNVGDFTVKSQDFEGEPVFNWKSIK